MAGIDILYLLDRLEEVLNSGSRLPFSSRTMIDEQECLDILDQIRVALPDEIKQARRINAERDGIIAEAEQVEADADRRSAEIRREADEYAYDTLSELESELEQLLLTVRKGTRALRPVEDARRTRRPSSLG